jgi:hypothetical protein
MGMGVPSKCSFEGPSCSNSAAKVVSSDAAT